MRANTANIVFTVAMNAAKNTRTTPRQCSRKSRASGVCGSSAPLPALNSGVSSSRLRITRPTTTTAALIQNGIRQPQELSWSSESTAASGRKTAGARICPPWVPLSVKLVKKPRRSSGACSKDIELAPACSPAAEMPCRMRSTTSSTGAISPICW